MRNWLKQCHFNTNPGLAGKLNTMYKMKSMKQLMGLLIIAPLLFSCNQKKLNELETQVAELSGENAEYEKLMNQRDQELDDYFATMNEVESNLEEIKKHEGIISTNLTSEGANQKENIISSIEALNELIQKNKSLVSQLDKKYKNANFKIKELDKMIASLNEQIDAKESELALLQAELESSNFQIASLTTELGNVTAANERLEDENERKANTIAAQSEELNTGYYVIGTFKELKEMNVLTKEGGFIGIGRNKGLTEDFNADAFTKVDIRSFDELPINTKGATIVTDHIASSYELTGEKKNVESLVINDHEEFWKASKYLVVLTD